MFEKKIEREVEKRVEELEAKIKNDLRAAFSKEIRRTCRALVYEMFNNEDDYETENYWGPTIHKIPTLTKSLKKGMLKAVEGRLKLLQAESFQQFTEGEEFIDRIVERIKKKQLK